jgi:hypothetical protein
LKIIRYAGKLPEAAQVLLEQGVLSGRPTQKERQDLMYDEGVDITYTLQGMTPAKFRQSSDALLLAAFQEAERYKEEKYRFARFVVRLNRTAKGRKTGISPTRDYTAAKHTDSDVMVYGEEALGYTLPEDYKKRPFLVNKVEEILDIPDSPSPGPYVQKQRPYKVLFMTICIRAGFNEITMKDIKRLKEGATE